MEHVNTRRTSSRAGGVVRRVGGAAAALLLCLLLPGLAGARPASADEPLVSLTKPRISGEALVGQTVTSDNGTWSIDASQLMFEHRWFVCASPDRCNEVPGYMRPFFPITSEHAGLFLKVEVTAETRVLPTSRRSRESDLFGPIDSGKPKNTVPPRATGRPVVGETLTTDTGAWQYADSYAYQWAKCDAAGNCSEIDKEREKTLRLDASLVGASVKVRVTAVNSLGWSIAWSEAVGPVAASATAPTNRVLPTVSGAPRLGARLTGSAGTWSGSTPLQLKYQWQRCNWFGSGCVSIGGETRDSFVPTFADLLWKVRLRVTASNGAGTAVAYSPAVGPIWF